GLQASLISRRQVPPPNSRWRRPAAARRLGNPARPCLDVPAGRAMSVGEKSLVALSGSRERLDNIELLRALAVLAVVLYHYTAEHPLNYMRYAAAPWPVTYGFMGVELFFIISGYCITMTAGHCRGLALFWARRLSRLWPAYIAAIAITFFVVKTYGLP